MVHVHEDGWVGGWMYRCVGTGALMDSQVCRREL